MTRAAVRAIGVRYGEELRTNDWYEAHRPALLKRATEKGLAKAFSPDDGDETSRGFDVEMARYVADPFRGATVRYLLGPSQTALGLELSAAQDALAAAGCTAKDIDVLLCASWLPEYFVAPGNAVFLARALGVSIPAYNLETACSSGLVGLELTEGLLLTGRYRRALLVLSSTNSRHTGDDDTLGWISSDVAAACVVEASDAQEGILSSYVENTAETCGVFEHRLVPDGAGGARVRMAVGSTGSKALRATSGPELVRRLCLGALARARVRLEDVAFFGFSSPLAWYATLCQRALEIPPERTTDLFPRLANIGLPFPAVHLHHALAEGKLQPGELALLYTVGSVSSAGAMVLRAGEVGLGPHPGAP
jgi:3-oxoacyl-[acyl-carrier-protein] synthase-3